MVRACLAMLGVVIALLAAAPGEADAQPQTSAVSALDLHLEQGLADAGGAAGAYVVDLSTGQTLYSAAANVGRLPASVEKLYTTTTALLRFGPNGTLDTSVLGQGVRGRRGTWYGTLYLRGGGDPTFGSAPFDHNWYGTGATVGQLIANLERATGITAVRGRVVGDESYFDSTRGTPATGFQPSSDVEGLLSGLAFDRGYDDLQGDAFQSRPALFATSQFVNALQSDGVNVPSSTQVYTGQTPARARLLVSIRSPRIATLIKLTNTPSDNYLAEMLLKGIGARFGGAGTTTAGAAVVRAEIVREFGIHPRLDDGSGLSRYDLTSPRDVVTLLRKMATNTPFVASLAVEGETGTLAHLTLGTIARGRCRGKTGTLRDVANTVGYCQARDGHTLAFAFLDNSVTDPTYTHSIEANMTVALADYDG
jgi:serine-type D-Ala-D-Ala carboxypeptidase/endopeptidase (penicillin-binding protein 4)